jgi:transposase
VKHLDLALRRRVDGHAGIEDEWVRSVSDLVATGIPVKAVAAHLHVSRQTVYDWLAKAHLR